MTQFAKKIVIGDRTIGPGRPTFIIAEIGVNHNGDMALAKRTIEAAAKAGVDSVKLQSFRSEEFMADRDLMYEYESNGVMIRESMYEMFKRLEFPLDKHAEIFDFARSCGVEPLTSVADPICLHAALQAGVNALKLSSEDLINIPLLEKVAAVDMPLILSTGMADAEEIKDAVALLERHNCRNAVFLHCVSLYPTELEEANLRRMQQVSALSGTMPGYSDHTLGPDACVAAVALGACIVEKHFTLDRTLPGPDHSFSADPTELETLVRRIRNVEQMLGVGEVDPVNREAEARLEFRRSIVAAHNLPAGHVLTMADLALKRPGNGMRPKEAVTLVGKKLVVDVAKNRQLSDNLFSLGGKR